MEKDTEKITRDQLLFKEFVAGVLIILLIFWAALLFPSPLSSPGGETVPPAVTIKAPWIFLAVQTLLHYLPPIWGGLILPAGILFLLALFPWESRVRRGPAMTLILFGLLLLSGVSLTLYGFFAAS